MRDCTVLLPEGLAAQVARACGATITAVKPRGGGGASRQGAELTLRYADGHEQHAYMNYDTLKGGAADDAAFAREAAVLRALSGPLRSAGVRVPRFIAALAESRALVTELVAGEADFNKLQRLEDRKATARDFMAQLAALHLHDPRAEKIDGFDELQQPSQVVRASVEQLRERHLQEGRHPLILLALDWLDRNVPEDPERIVIVHGDAGPANFLFADNRVTALLDWELVHYGDPMEDLAMICIRNLFQPFVPLPEAFAAYERAGGFKVDLNRVRYYRLFFQVRFASTLSRLGNPGYAPPPVLGMSLVYGMTHLRVLCEALAEAAGVTLQPITLPEAPAGVHHRSFAIALEDLREVIVPRLEDQQASAKAKGLARLIKWWRDSERFGPAFDAYECQRYAAVLGRSFSSAVEAREALCDALLSRALDLPAAIQLCHVSIGLDHALLANAMGTFASTHFAALE
ncbi:MAG: phosphotransferase family protein [Steroidobacteraceae bacterium]